MKYDPLAIEPKWQAIWEENKTFEISNDLEFLRNKPKYYVLDMFPYPSGAGLHVGHPEGYTATDVVARMKRMQGYNVLHPMGWDAFGLPAERAAMRDNIHPQIITKRNISNFKKQIKRLGFSYDWSREIATSDPSYYKFTQSIFLKLYEKGLAYLAEIPVNWCPALATVLANEEVKDGRYVETGDLVERRLMKQWMLKITEYAERLLADLNELDWPENVKEMQRNWIGKSTGAEVKFSVEGHNTSFDVFTTRPDTLMGVTFCVLAPEHALVQEIVSSEKKAELLEYVAYVLNESDITRLDVTKKKTGVFTGAYALHPLTGMKIPIWIADYVLGSYGTGAIMGVPAEDERDQQFANAFKLPIAAFVSDWSIVEQLEKKGVGRAKTTYRLRDWLFSRQRYWGEPFPLIHLEDGTVLPVNEEELPVELPKIDAYRPTDDGLPPLARADESWLNVTLPDGRKGRRELNTMPQWAGSCWYYLRFLDPKNPNELCAKELENYWMPVDLYIGGVEHAVLHLLYARFWHKVLFDCGIVHTKEPFQKLFNQGFILAKSYRDEMGKYYHPEDIEEREGKSFTKKSSIAVVSQVEKMSKSKLNVVNPDEVVDEYGADAMRLYELFMGPLEQVKMWQMSGVEGVYRFLQRTWRLVIDETTGNISSKVTGESSDNPDLLRKLHQTIKKVTDDTQELKFNTAISQMMTFVNEATAAQTISMDVVRPFIKILAPFAPHMAEELWERMGEKTTLSCRKYGAETWPQYDVSLCAEEKVSVVLQINGKKRDEIWIEHGLSDQEIQILAMASPLMQKFLAGAVPKRVVVVRGRLVNVVI